MSAVRLLAFPALRGAWGLPQTRCGAWSTGCRAAAQTQPETTLVPHGTAMTHPSRLLRRVGRQQLAQGAVQSQTELFEYVQADILLAHLDPMEGGFRNPQLPREGPVWGVPASPSYFAC